MVIGGVAIIQSGAIDLGAFAGWLKSNRSSSDEWAPPLDVSLAKQGYKV